MSTTDLELSNACMDMLSDLAAGMANEMTTPYPRGITVIIPQQGVLRIELAKFIAPGRPFREFHPLKTTADLSATSLAEAALIVGPAFAYDVYVHPSRRLFVRERLWSIISDTQVDNNPMSPHLNLLVDETLSPEGWYVVANGKSVGSDGVG